jgi:hypothetical protein
MIYSFRAEVMQDVTGFLLAPIDLSGAAELDQVAGAFIDRLTMQRQWPGHACDWEVEFESSADLLTLQMCMAKIPDGHVMLQTLRAVPLAENSLERER